MVDAQQYALEYLFLGRAHGRRSVGDCEDRRLRPFYLGIAARFLKKGAHRLYGVEVSIGA